MTDTSPRRFAAPLTEILDHLRRVAQRPASGGPPHVWVAGCGSSADDATLWMDIGPLDAVCQQYPLAAPALREMTPSRSLGWTKRLELSPSLLVEAAIVGEPAAAGSTREGS